GNPIVAGALAVNVATTQTSADVSPGAAISAAGANVKLDASSTTGTTAQATPATAGSSAGVGASVAVNVGNGTTQAVVGLGAGLAGAHDLTLGATSTDTMTTTAQNGASGGTGITPDVAVSVSNLTTTARLDAGPLVTIAGL